jgi:hypothetical protein
MPRILAKILIAYNLNSDVMLIGDSFVKNKAKRMKQRAVMKREQGRKGDTAKNVREDEKSTIQYIFTKSGRVANRP